MQILEEIVKNPGTAAVVAATAGLGLVGALEGWTLSVIIPSVSIAGHTLMLGMWPVAGIAMFALAASINRNVPLSIFAAFPLGYLASYATTNLLGFSVSLLAPVLGVAIVAVVAFIVVAIFSMLFPFFLVGAGTFAIAALSALKN